MKCKYSDIKEIYDWYNKYAGEKEKELYNKQLSGNEIAYYTPSSANWSYIITLINIDGLIYKAVTVFGSIKAVMPCNMWKYTREEIKEKRAI